MSGLIVKQQLSEFTGRRTHYVLRVKIKYFTLKQQKARQHHAMDVRLTQFN